MRSKATRQGSSGACIKPYRWLVHSFRPESFHLRRRRLCVIYLCSTRYPFCSVLFEMINRLLVVSFSCRLATHREVK